MKPSKITIEGKKVQPLYGMAVVEYVCELKGFEYLDEALSLYSQINFERLRVEDMKNLCLLVKAAVQLGESEEGRDFDISDVKLKSWAYANIEQVALVINEFAKSLNSGSTSEEGSKKKKTGSALES